MNEFVLVAVIIALLSYIGWNDYLNRKERKTMHDIIVAKNNQELVNLRMAESVKIQTPTKQDMEYTALEDLSDEDFEKHVLGGVNGN